MKTINQPHLLLTISIVLLCTVVWPPWNTTLDRQGQHLRSDAGYHFLFRPPKPAEQIEYGWGVAIDFSRLALEWLALGSAGATLFFFASARKPRDRTYTLAQISAMARALEAKDQASAQTAQTVVAKLQADGPGLLHEQRGAILVALGILFAVWMFSELVHAIGG